MSGPRCASYHKSHRRHSRDINSQVLRLCTCIEQWPIKFIFENPTGLLHWTYAPRCSLYETKKFVKKIISSDTYCLGSIYRGHPTE